MKAETIIYWVVSALKPFRRNKIPAEKKIRAVELLQGLSYRQVFKILEISHTRAETVQKLAEAIYKPKILAVWITATRNWWVAGGFILVVLKSCEGRPVFLVDNARVQVSGQGIVLSVGLGL
ncbi:transposase-like protein [Thermococcus stetteri]|nr:transposase-like protein [Thermococcus stetteri]